MFQGGQVNDGAELVNKMCWRPHGMIINMIIIVITIIIKIVIIVINLNLEKSKLMVLAVGE